LIGVVRTWLKAEKETDCGQKFGKLIDNVVPAGSCLVGVMLKIIIESTFI